MRAILSAACGLLLCATPPARAQPDETIVTVAGAWTISIRPHRPRTIAPLDRCEASLAETREGWRFRLVRGRDGLRATIANERLRLWAGRGEVVTGSIGGQAVRFRFEGGAEILDQEAFRRGMEAGGELRIRVSDDEMRWRIDGGARVLAAFATCHWLDPGAPR